jgi:hypothetical protein
MRRWRMKVGNIFEDENMGNVVVEKEEMGKWIDKEIITILSVF